MNNNDWQRTEELFHEAISLSAERRAAYLAQACQKDDSLRAEVESLIAAFENKHGFMEQAAFNLGMRVLSGESKREAMTGKQIGPYKILALLGKGGMGEVYLARDDRLDRKVALKFLSNKLTNDAGARRQLMREAQAIARLDHPNICAVYDFEEQDGYNFIVMQYVEGETLASLISKRLLEPDQILGLSVQIASALVEAHSNGIIHRDIKPQNIMVAANGQVKVLDFGLAKLIERSQGPPGDSESHSSQLGLVMGTVAYMSPEQLRAERLDFRSDVFSFGIVVYEMISGRNPYTLASNAEIISAILTSDPEPPTNFSPAIPAGLGIIAQKCLKRDREQRYQSASELLLDLDNPPKEAASGSRWQAYFNTRNCIAAALLLLLIITASLVYSDPAKIQTLLILPIANKSDDTNAEFLRKGLTEGLTNRVSRLSKVRVKAPTIIPSYEDEADAQYKAGRDFNVDAVLFGALIQQGGSLALQVTLVNGADGSRMWQEAYVVKPGELLRLQDELAYELTSILQPSTSEDEKRLLSARPTQNDEAYKMYFYGRYYWNERDSENIKKAIVYFEQAIRLDPAYARAYAGLSDCYALLSTVAYGPPLSTRDAMSKTRWAAKKALEIDDTLCEAHTSLGLYILRYEWNWQEAEKEFKRAINLNPDYAPAHFWYSNLLALTGRSDESIKEGEMARDLEPFSPLSAMNLGRAYYYSRQYDRALDHCLKNLENNPYHLATLNVLGFAYLQKGMMKQSIDSFQKLYSADKLYGAAPLGYAYAKAGRRNDALEILNEMKETSKRTYIPPQEKALIYLGLDDKNQAFELLEEACQERFATFPFLLIEPFLDGIRSDSRFVDLVQRTILAR